MIGVHHNHPIRPCERRDMPNQIQQITNTLRLNQRELHKFLETFDRDENQSSSPDREFVRWTYRVESVNLVIEHTSGNRVTLPVATRNISRGGISILHSSFVHPGTQCEIILNIPGGSIQSVMGTVRRCSHLSGRVHEIGIQFKNQISTKDLLGLDPLNEAYSLERVEPSRLHGSVLIVTSSEMDRELYTTFLDDTNLNVSTADSIENATARAQKGADIVLADYYIEEETAPSLITALSEVDIDVPVIILTSDKSEQALDSIRDSNAMGILTKPASKERILQALAEFLHADGDGGPLYSILEAGDSAYPLLNKFLSEISRTSLNLEKAAREGDETTCLKITRTLSGTAAPLGFPDISALSITAENQIASQGLKASLQDIRSLIVACRRIKARPAA